jgi:hypothetical protein
VLTTQGGGRRTGVTGYCWGPEPGNAPHRRQAGGREGATAPIPIRLVAVEGKTLKLAGILHLTGAADITTALRHHAHQPHRPLQTLKTR